MAEQFNLSRFLSAVDAIAVRRYSGTLPHQVTASVDLINWRGFAVGSTCVVGLQWGDEAKGKIVDLLCDQHDVVVRYQGGANAGHTVVVDGVTYKLSLVPTGILRPGVDAVIGNGVVIHPPALLKEIETLAAQGVDVGRTAPYQRPGSRHPPVSSGRGTADRGVGLSGRPSGDDAQGDRSVLSRQGRPGSRGSRRRPLPSGPFRDRLARIIDYKNRLLGAMLPDFRPFDAGAVADEYLGLCRAAAAVRPRHDVLAAPGPGGGRRLLFEGAQGSLLDVDHGSYPYVTSSNSSAAGIAAGSGVPTRHIDRWIGVVKAYTTRVGGGPFPTEQDNAIGERIRRVGKEFGTVTGRPRRCGWFDAVAVRHAARISGSTELAVMLLDVLSGIDELNVAVAYELDGERTNELPSSLADFEHCRPIYETLPGWSEDHHRGQAMVRPSRAGAEITSNSSANRWGCP